MYLTLLPQSEANLLDVERSNQNSKIIDPLTRHQETIVSFKIIDSLVRTRR